MQDASIHAVDFKTMADAVIHKQEQQGRLAGHDLYLTGVKKWIGQEEIVSRMMAAFKEMSGQEKAENLPLLKRCCLEVKNSEKFSWYDKMSAKINFFFIEKSLHAEQSRVSKSIQNVIEAVRGFFKEPAGAGGKDAAKLTRGDAGRHISKEWNDGEGRIVLETIDRRDTFASFKKNAAGQLHYVRSRLNTEDLSAQERAELLSVAARLETASIYPVLGNSWVNSDHFRDILRGDYTIASSKNPDELRGAIAAFEAKMENAYYPAAPAVNLRYQTCETGDSKIGWLRFGVISDMSNGYVNLQTMEGLNLALESGNLETASAMRSTMAKEIIAVWRSSLVSGNKAADASAGYALKQLGYSLNEIMAIKSLVDRKWGVEDNFLAILPKNRPLVLQAVHKALGLRTQVLEGQFLQVVADHAQRITSKDMQQGLMKMLHVCVLNTASKVVDGSGWYHNEENEMLDMAAIFDKFHGKRLIADALGPFIDKEGNIHVPPTADFPEKKELNLYALLVNECGAGQQGNYGAQGAVNTKTAARLQKLQLDADRGFAGILNARTTSFSKAADIADLALKRGFKVSIACASAKDRTGFTSALTAERMLRDQAQFPKLARRKFMVDALGEDSVEVAVVRDNTGASVLKVQPFRIEGLTKRNYNLQSIMQRGVIYFRQGIEIINERRRIKEYEKSGKPKP